MTEGSQLRMRLDQAVRTGQSATLNHTELRQMMEHVKNLEEEVKGLSSQLRGVRHEPENI